MTNELIIAGIGAGARNLMTEQLQQIISDSDIVLGAKRMLGGITDKETGAAYTYDDVKPYLTSGKYESVLVLMSGDSGFYSGAKKLYEKVKADNDLSCWSVSILPGISSISYFAAKCGESYDDAVLYSMHGREVYEWKGPIVDAVRYNAKVFTLLAGCGQIMKLQVVLGEYFGDEISITLGYMLSYPEEAIIEVSVYDRETNLNDGLYVALIKNNKPENKRIGYGIRDAEFIRGKVPMTKQEVRHISIDKLELCKGAVLYDIGCGTGSVAIEAALCDPSIRVFATDRNADAAELTRRNAIIHKAANVEVYCKQALDFLQSEDFLPAPTHAFIGGSGGDLEAIIEKLYELNENVIIVITAVTLDTIAKAQEFMGEQSECIYLAVSRNECIGTHQMMKAENQVAIIRL